MVSRLCLVVLVVTAFVLTTFPFTTHGETPVSTNPPAIPALEWMAQLGGTPGGVFTIHAPYLYFKTNNGQQIKVMDISNPTMPRIVGETPILEPYEGYTLTWVNGYLYTGAEIIDVRNPTQPAFVRDFHIDTDMVVEGTRLYAHHPGPSIDCTLSAYDVSNPAQPQLLEDEVIRSDGVHCLKVMDVEGTFMLINLSPFSANYEASLVLLDVTHPDAPLTLAVIPAGPYVLIDGAQIMGDALYLSTNSWNGTPNPRLRIYDIQDRTNPILISEMTEPSGEFILENQRLYVHKDKNFAENAAISTWNVENPLQPVKLGEYLLPNRPIYQLFIEDGFKYRLDHDTLQIRELTDLNAPPLLSDYRGWSADSGISNNGYLYIVDPDFVGNQVNLRVIDARTPTSPTLVNTLPMEGFASYHLLQQQGETLYLGSETGLKILNIANPVNPTFSYEGTIVMPTALLIEGNTLYALIRTENYESRLVVLNVATPTTPIILGMMKLPGIIWDSMTIKEDVLYVGAQPGVLMVDVTIPTTPTLLGSVGEISHWGAIDIEGNALYLVGRNEEQLEIYDITTPETPIRVATHPLPKVEDSIYQVDANGTLAYITYYNGMVALFDVANPQKIQFLQLYTDHLLFGAKIQVEANHVFLWGNVGGLDILHLTDRLRLTMFLPQISRGP